MHILKSGFLESCVIVFSGLHLIAPSLFIFKSLTAPDNLSRIYSEVSA
jgi:hypothetical protein